MRLTAEQFRKTVIKARNKRIDQARRTKEELVLPWVNEEVSRIDTALLGLAGTLEDPEALNFLWEPSLGWQQNVGILHLEAAFKMVVENYVRKGFMVDVKCKPGTVSGATARISLFGDDSAEDED